MALGQGCLGNVETAVIISSWKRPLALTPEILLCVLDGRYDVLPAVGVGRNVSYPSGKGGKYLTGTCVAEISLFGVH